MGGWVERNHASRVRFEAPLLDEGLKQKGPKRKDSKATRSKGIQGPRPQLPV
jgi:hypothetical protein